MIRGIPSFDDAPVQTASEIDRLLIHAENTLINGRRNGPVIGAAVCHVVRNNPHFGMRYCETRYRHFQSRTFLLAIPASQAPSSTVPRDVRSRQRLPFFLWASINGEADMFADADKLGVDFEENLDNLDHTGMLMVS